MDEPAVVLIVDDDPQSAASLRDKVRQCGHDPVVATNWTDALRYCTEAGTEIDAVLMDAVMPSVDGFKLTKILRNRANSYIPIVFVTQLDDDASRQRAVAAGADDYLTKPVRPFELRVRLEAMLRIRRMTRSLEAKTRDLAAMANIDALTGLGNRRSFDDRLSVEVGRAQRYHRPVSLLMIDLDHFKRVNDSLGHAVGDAVLDFFGRLVRENSRACDLPYRYGGEEFVIIAPETSAYQAVFLAERVRRAFELRSPEATTAGAQTLSVGISGSELVPNADPMALVGSADAALYRAKRDGRNRVCCFDPDHGGIE